MLMFNGGECQQNGSEGIIDVYQNRAVIYQTAAGALTQFQVQFAACPFASCPVDSRGISANVGQPTLGAVGTTFNYSSMTINNEPCKDAASMGVHVNPAR